MPEKRPTKPRAERNQGGMYEKTAYWIDKSTGAKHKYTYWQASKDIAEKDLPEGMTRKRITGSGKSRSEARLRLEENVANFYKGIPSGRTKRKPKPKHTIASLYDEWQLKNKAGRVSDIMYAKYNGYGKHIKNSLGHIHLDALEEEHLVGFFSTALPRLKNKKGEPLLGSAARRNIYMALSGCFTYAVDKDYLKKHPLDPIEVPKRTLPKDDIETAIADGLHLLNRLKEEKDPDYCRWLFSLLGLRRAERLGLDWSNIKKLDMEKPELVISQQLARTAKKEDGGWIIKGTKTGRTRVIVLPEPWISTLREYKIRQDEMKKSKEWKPEEKFNNFVFLQPNGAIYTLNHDNNDWNKLFKKYSIPPFRGHLMRHITATMLAEQIPAVPIPTVMSIIGHESQAMLFYYSKITAEQQSQHMATLGVNLEKMMKKYSRSK